MNAYQSVAMVVGIAAGAVCAAADAGAFTDGEMPLLAEEGPSGGSVIIMMGLAFGLLAGAAAGLELTVASDTIGAAGLPCDVLIPSPDGAGNHAESADKRVHEVTPALAVEICGCCPAEGTDGP